MSSNINPFLLYVYSNPTSASTDPSYGVVQVNSNNGNNVFSCYFRFALGGAGAGGETTSYTTSDIQVGDWIICALTGFVWRIINVTIRTVNDFVAFLEDVDNYNFYIDTSTIRIGGPPSGTQYFYVFRLNSDGLPMLTSILNPGIGDLFSDAFGRFNMLSNQRQYINIYQPNNTLTVGTPIFIDSADGLYKNSTFPDNTKKTIGIVSTVSDIPGWFTFKAFGTYYLDVSNNFPNLIINNDGSVGFTNSVPGTYYYLLNDGTGNYTTDSNSGLNTLMWIYLGKDSITNKETALLYALPGGNSSSGGGSNGTGGTGPTGPTGPTLNVTNSLNTLNNTGTFLLQNSDDNIVNTNGFIRTEVIFDPSSDAYVYSILPGITGTKTTGIAIG